VELLEQSVLLRKHMDGMEVMEGMEAQVTDFSLVREGPLPSEQMLPSSAVASKAGALAGVGVNSKLL
jgi:hypothetical protein